LTNFYRGWIRVPRTNWFKLLGGHGLNAEQIWGAVHDAGIDGQTPRGRLFETFIRALVGPDPSAPASTPDRPTHEIDPPSPFVRPHFDTLTTTIASIVPTDGVQAQFDIATLAAASSGTTPTPDSAQSTATTEQHALIGLGTLQQLSFTGDAAAVGGLRGITPEYVISVTDFSDPGIVYEARSMQLLPGGPGNFPELLSGPDDNMRISGDFSAGAMLQIAVRGIDSVELRAGNSYNFTSGDDLVEAGHLFKVSAATLGEGDHFLFDGSAETDGRFFFLGSQNGDVIIGGAGNDSFYGLDGGDLMSGGGGSDTFAYRNAGESTGVDFDTIGDFDPTVDKIDLPGAVTGFDATIGSGSLSLGSFDDDLSAALGGLGAGHAAWFAPTEGDMAGTVFLIVDGNGKAGYQPGEDYVIAMGGPLADLSGHTGFFV
jgi:hypothetical protein